MAETDRSPGQAFLPEQVAIDAYGAGGFRFRDMSHRGSLLCLPSGMHDWRVSDGGGLMLEDFSAVIAEGERIEVLLIGTGSNQLFLPPELKRQLSDAGLFAETMATGAAARTYNVLLAEARAVAAALVAVA